MQGSPLTSSYRDPAGFMFTVGGRVYRQINQLAKEDYRQLHDSGLYQALLAQQLVIPHKEVTLRGLPKDPKRLVVIQPEAIPFISYPYDWSYSQLRDAALLTLKIQKLALGRGMILKDASAYNVQFIGKRPVFIDTLSFTRYQTGQGWEGYKQFCEQFLAPLAI